MHITLVNFVHFWQGYFIFPHHSVLCFFWQRLTFFYIFSDFEKGKQPPKCFEFSDVCQFVVEYLTAQNAVSMLPSPLDIAKNKLFEFKPFFDNPRLGSHGTKEVLEWTYHNPNGSEETQWVPLKTKENQPLTNSKMKNNIHCRCMGVLEKLPAASRPTRPQISIHAPSSQPAHQRGASSELATSTRSSAEREEVIEQIFLPDGTIASRRTWREAESHEETTMLKNQVIELKQELNRLVDAQQDDLCKMHEIHEAERKSWNEKKACNEQELAKMRKALDAERERNPNSRSNVLCKPKSYRSKTITRFLRRSHSNSTQEPHRSRIGLQTS